MSGTGEETAQPDAGTSTPDAGTTTPDAGTTDPGDADGGCGCQSTGSGQPLGSMLIFGLALGFLWIRRRRR